MSRLCRYRVYECVSQTPRQFARKFPRTLLLLPLDLDHISTSSAVENREIPNLFTAEEDAEDGAEPHPGFTWVEPAADDPLGYEPPSSHRSLDSVSPDFPPQNWSICDQDQVEAIGERLAANLSADTDDRLNAVAAGDTVPSPESTDGFRGNIEQLINDAASETGETKDRIRIVYAIMM